MLSITYLECHLRAVNQLPGMPFAGSVNQLPGMSFAGSVHHLPGMSFAGSVCSCYIASVSVYLIFLFTLGVSDPWLVNMRM